jgi:tRNA U34 5-methylaminomethyl-2-thiouridine-forming methyltransferase MnmC
LDVSDFNTPAWIPQATQDGSHTYFSEEFGEAFHSKAGAKTEALTKYVQQTRLPLKATQSKIALLDVCYGLGYNTAAALETIWQINPDCQVHLYGLELDRTVPISAIAPTFLQHWSVPVQQVLIGLAHDQQVQQPNLSAQLLIGDARQTIQPLKQAGFQADAIFFDPFSPPKCPQLWTVEFFQVVATCLATTGILATYSRAASVRRAIQLAGLAIGTIPHLAGAAAHEWSQGTVAAWDGQSLHPLSLLEQEHLQTRAAIPYRDPTLCDRASIILERHHHEQQQSVLESTSSWRRRWGIR